VRREQRQRAVGLGEPVRDRPGEREAVVGRRAAADLVDQHEALRRRAMQDAAASVISTMNVERRRRGRRRRRCACEIASIGPSARARRHERAA
jgi:hypothetical protein